MDGRTIQEEVLGRLTWDERQGWWAGEVDLDPGHPVAIAVCVDGPDLVTALRSARRALEAVREGDEDFRHSAADQMLRIHNRVWNDGPEIDEDEFVERLWLAAITFYPDGTAALFYDDDGLFRGRDLVVAVDADGAFERATVAE